MRETSSCAPADARCAHATQTPQAPQASSDCTHRARRLDSSNIYSDGTSTPSEENRDGSESESECYASEYSEDGRAKESESTGACPPIDASRVEELVLYNATYSVLICRPCATCLPPGAGVKRHLMDFHRRRPLQLRRACDTYARRLSLVRPEELMLPAPGGAAVAGLAVHEGWRCGQCAWLGVREATMQEHCRKAHRWTKADGRRWEPALLQTFFAGARQRLFEVRAPFVAHKDEQLQRNANAPAQRLLERAERDDREEAQEAVRLEDEAAATAVAADGSPWMRKTRWARKFAGQDLHAIAACAALPAREEGALQSVRKSIERVLGRCRRSIADWHAEEEDGDVVLGWLNSASPTECEPTPFSTYYRASTHTIYTSHWTRCLCYLLRLVHEDEDERHGLTLPAEDEEALRAIWDTVEFDQGRDNGATLDARVFNASVALWTRNTRADARSALIHCTAVLGIDPRTASFRPPWVYSPIAAGLRYCARLLLFESALPAASRDAINDCCDTFRRTHCRWLVTGRPTPFHYVSNLLAYASKAGKGEGAKPRVQWTADRQTLVYQGQRLPLSTLRSFAGELCNAAEELLHGPLYFHASGPPGDRSLIDLATLVDNMNDVAVGYSFAVERRNGLDGGRRRMAERLAASADAASFLDGDRPLVDSPGWQRYRVSFERFQTLLFLLVHLCGGAPARGTEVLPVRHANVAQAPRNLFLSDNRLLLITSYHKSQSLTGQQRVIARFLPPRVGQLVAAYVADILPFTLLVDPNRIPHSARSFLWADEKGVWSTRRATRALAQETAVRLGLRITIRDYRHISKAIDREHVRVRQAEGAGALASRESESEGEGEGEGDDIHDLASGHTTATADAVYGIDASMLRSLTSHSLQAFRAVSSRWHQFWNLPDAGTGVVRTRAASASSESPPSKRRAKENDIGNSEAGDDLEGELAQGLQRLYPGAGFRSPEQQQALLAIQQGLSPIVVVLPPGGGKSLLFQLPASLRNARTTLVVLPFRALAHDLIKRCRALGLTSCYWTAQRPRSAQLVFVSAEAAATNDEFLGYAAGLQLEGELDRIVIDECHVPLSAASYRHQLSNLARLRAIPCPLLLLTGTLPPQMEESLEQRLLLGSAAQGLRYVRARTDRPNIEYCVEEQASSEAAEERVHELLDQARTSLALGRRAIAFCRTRATCERLARRLACLPYHRRLEGKEEALAAWADGPERVIVATTALGTGVDLAGVDLVVHLGQPFGIVDYVQEVGRAGREGQKARSIVVLAAQELRWLRAPASQEVEPNLEGLRQFLVEEGCRRARLGAVMDGHEAQCREAIEPPRHACDLCAARAFRVRETAGITKAQQRVRARQQAQRYSSGPELWQARLEGQSLEQQRILQAVQEIGQGCAACWLYNGVAAAHYLEQCERLRAAIEGVVYGQVRRLIRFESGSYCCYQCSLPGDWCPRFSQRQQCAGPDVLTPLVLAAWGTPQGRQLLTQKSQCENINSLARWLGRIQTNRVGGARATNLIGAAEAVIFLFQ